MAYDDEVWSIGETERTFLDSFYKIKGWEEKTTKEKIQLLKNRLNFSCVSDENTDEENALVALEIELIANT